MKKQYDFSPGTRGLAASTQGKTRIKLYLDNGTLEHFKAESEQAGEGTRYSLTRH